MKKSELKSIIKECVKEVILEEGVLSGIVSEVVRGMGTAPLVEERTPVPQARNERDPQMAARARRRILDSVAENSYAAARESFSKPEYFKGTKPIVESGGTGPMAGVAPSDSGVDISRIPGFSTWSTVANKIGK